MAVNFTYSTVPTLTDLLRASTVHGCEHPRSRFMHYTGAERCIVKSVPFMAETIMDMIEEPALLRFMAESVFKKDGTFKRPKSRLIRNTTAGDQRLVETLRTQEWIEIEKVKYRWSAPKHPEANTAIFR